MQINSSKQFTRGWRRLLGNDNEPHGVWESDSGVLIAANVAYTDAESYTIEYTILQGDIIKNNKTEKNCNKIIGFTQQDKTEKK